MIQFFTDSDVSSTGEPKNDHLSWTFGRQLSSTTSLPGSFQLFFCWKPCWERPEALPGPCSSFRRRDRPGGPWYVNYFGNGTPLLETHLPKPGQAGRTTGTTERGPARGPRVGAGGRREVEVLDLTQGESEIITTGATNH